jgi:hypothetical protein
MFGLAQQATGLTLETSKDLQVYKDQLVHLLRDRPVRLAQLAQRAQPVQQVHKDNKVYKAFKAHKV